MAINALTMDNFLGKTVTHKFGVHNRIAGANGVGKSSIKEAICFLFTGCDSSGTRNPQHLISIGQHNAKVTVLTDKAEISRTLTRNGNGTIKVTKAGISQTLSQNELEGLVGPLNVFLSVFIPGFFLKLSSEKQHQVLSELLPKIPKEEMLKELTGIDLSAEELLRWGVRMKRVDLVANAVAMDRREFERQKDQLLGELKVYGSVQARPAPQKPEVEIAKLAEYELTLSQWKWYDEEYGKFSTREVDIKEAEATNVANENRRKYLQAEISKLVTSDLMAVPNHSAKINEYNDQMVVPPIPPALFNIIDADQCPTCGQTVGLKHREKTQAHNQLEKEKYEADSRVAAVKNSDLKALIAKLKEETQSITEKNHAIANSNSKIQAQKHTLELQLAKIVDRKVPERLEEPKSPDSLVPNMEDYHALQNVIKSYNRSVIEHEHEQKAVAEADSKIAQCNTVLKTLEESIDRLRIIEKGFSQVPQEEMRRQIEALKMETVELTVNDSIVVTKGGIHYNHLSTGQRMSADVQICRKFNSLMPRPINLIFLDNADLVDSFDWGDTQMFAAFVDATKLEVVIEENTL